MQARPTFSGLSQRPGRGKQAIGPREHTVHPTGRQAMQGGTALRLPSRNDVWASAESNHQAADRRTECVGREPW